MNRLKVSFNFRFYWHNPTMSTNHQKSDRPDIHCVLPCGKLPHKPLKVTFPVAGNLVKAIYIGCLSLCFLFNTKSIYLNLSLVNPKLKIKKQTLQLRSTCTLYMYLFNCYNLRTANSGILLCFPLIKTYRTLSNLVIMLAIPRL